MKSNIILKSIFAFAATALAVTGCKQPDEEISLKLSMSAYTFPADVAEGMENSVTIGVTADKAWTVELENKADSWVKIGDMTSNSVIISADNNDGGQREAILVFKCGFAERKFTVYQFPYEKNMARYRDLEFIMDAQISPNGKYAGGYTIDYDESGQSVYTPILVNVETDERIFLGKIKMSQHHITNTDAVSNDGTLYFSDGANGGSFSVDLNDNIVEMPRPTAFNWQPNVSQVSADGTTIVGFGVKTSIDGSEDAPYEYGYWPIVWNDLEPQTLTRPDKTFRGMKAWAGVMARGVSNDGNVIYGTAWATEENVVGGMTYWKKNGNGWTDVEWVGGVYKGTTDPVYVLTPTEFDDKDGKYSLNLVDGFVTTAQSYNISETGKWIAGEFISESKSGNSIATVVYPGFFNTETGESTIFKDMPGCGAVAVTDEGLGFVVSGANSGVAVSSGYVVDVNNKVSLGTCLEWIKGKYDINVTTGYVRYMCADGNTAFCLRVEGGGPGGSSVPAFYVTTPKK